MPIKYKKRHLRYHTDALFRKKIIAAVTKYRRKHKKKIKAYQKEWSYKNKDRLLKEHFKNRLKREYNLTVEAFNQLLKQQKGRCAICFKKVRLCIDHDHKTGKVRGLVCFYCNTLLAVFDNKQLFKRMLKYTGVI